MTPAVKKIIKAYFGKTEIDINGLIEIIEKTGNADVALEMLLGTYEQPEIPNESFISVHKCTFGSFDKWTNNVSYTYVGPEYDHIYINKDVDPKSLTPENYKEYQVRYDDPTRKLVWIMIKADAEQKQSCSLTEWMAGVDTLNGKAF
ncbi:hypothetical protein WBJ53_26000 [Spirosoma sp. SC4-14]|uniref:hypothetical protein n=1 Tax=Spirosoma sp. SC4-14 TaxID=3128900 RepID=UPI0030D4B263